MTRETFTRERRSVPIDKVSYTTGSTHAGRELNRNEIVTGEDRFRRDP
jgi:hypothetical protein